MADDSVVACELSHAVRVAAIYRIWHSVVCALHNACGPRIGTHDTPERDRPAA